MKKLICTVLALMLITTMVFADTSMIELSSATDADLNSIMQMIQAEKVERYKEKFANQHIESDTDGITFRGIPWYSTLDTVESAIGQVSSYRSVDDLRRLSYTDYSSISSGSDRVDGDLGCNLSYSGLSVAGYRPTSTRISYVFPIIDGQIIRDFQFAEVYMGYYTFEDEDYGDLSKVYDDLAVKLEKLYGEGTMNESEYFNNTIWKDQTENTIRLQINYDASYMTLAYVAGTADMRLDEMAEAYVNEKIQAEDAIRYENVDNVDGL